MHTVCSWQIWVECRWIGGDISVHRVCGRHIQRRWGVCVLELCSRSVRQRRLADDGPVCRTVHSGTRQLLSRWVHGGRWSDV